MTLYGFSFLNALLNTAVASLVGFMVFVLNQDFLLVMALIGFVAIKMLGMVLISTQSRIPAFLPQETMVWGQRQNAPVALLALLASDALSVLGLALPAYLYLSV